MWEIREDGSFGLHLYRATVILAAQRDLQFYAQGHSMTVILTACTMRKRFSPVPSLQASRLRVGTLSAVGTEWRDRIARSQPRAKAIDVYSGRSLAEARIAATTINGQLMIVSAGLGLLEAEEPIPSYDITVSPGSAASIFTKLPVGTSERDWWNEIADQRKIEQLERRLEDAKSLLLVSLPAAYLRMLTHLIGSLSATQEGRLRIFTGSEQLEIEPSLKPFHMPYDRRLDGPDSPITGTLGDFAQRALRHFATTILPSAPTGTAAEHADFVLAKQRDWQRPSRKAGARISDEEVLQIIRERWDSVGGRSASLLRLFRDELGLACEQRRFSKLAAVIREEKALQ